jgi:hypothetical protein
MAAHLGLDASHLEAELRRLSATGAVAAIGEPQRYSLGPAGDERVLEELARLFATRRVAVIRAIFSRPDAADPLADA